MQNVKLQNFRKTVGEDLHDLGKKAFRFANKHVLIHKKIR